MKRSGSARVTAITTQAAAAHCQVSVPTLKRWIRAGSLRAFRTPGGHHRIVVADFQRFLEAEGMPPYPGPGQGERILIVDDAAETIDLLKTLLEADPRGFKLESAADGYEALVKVGSFKPTLLILDIVMPSMDGIEVCRRLRAGAETRHIKILGVTGRPELIPALREAGAHGCLEKPWRLDQFKEEVDRLLSATAGPSEGREGS